MEGDFDASFEYGPDDQRRKMSITQAGAPYRERIYVAGGLYERDFYNGQWRNLAYINTPTGQEAVVITDESTQDQNIYFLNRDYLGSIISIADAYGGILEEYSYDAWGNRRDPQTWQNQYNPGQNNNLWTGLLYRGYTGHEHLDCFGLINMNGRLYDPLLGRMLSPDNYVQNASFSQNFNRYTYVYNNPLKYTDPDGEIAWFVPVIIGAAVFGTGNVAIQAANGNINSFGDFASAFVAGAITGAVAGATWSFGLAALNGTALVGGKTIISGITLKSGLAKAAAWTTLGAKSINTLTTTASMISNPGNALELAFGKTYLDENRSLIGQTLQGISRFTWEGFQSWVGYNYSQLRNVGGSIDRVEYFGGATFALQENTGGRGDGISLGNYINANLPAAYNGVPGDGLLMHEFGHTFDSHTWGPAYLPVIGLSSAMSAERSRLNPATGFGTHRDHWTERSANRHAARYFDEHFNINWNNWEIPFFGPYWPR